MSFKFPNLSSLQSTLQQTTQQLTSTFQDNLQHLEKEVSSLNSNLSPILKRTQRSLQERFGSIDDISELPQEYKDLEKKVDNLKAFYKKTSLITSQYEIESYDYPPNLRESLNDYTKIINEKFNGLSQATTTSEAEAVLLASSKDQTPKTFHHQLSKSFKASRDLILSNSGEDELEDETSFTKCLLKVSEYEYKIGDERLEQDRLIISEFNNKVKTILSVDFEKTSKLRKQVEISRLNFDTIRSEIKSYQKGDESVEVPDKLSKRLEFSEDELVSATEAAVESMKHLIKPVETINLIKIFVKIQLNYHKNIVGELSSLVDELETLPVDEE